MFGFGEFSPGLYALEIKKPLMNQFRTASLNREIVLSKSNFRLAGIAVLCYKIAGIACKHDVIYLTLSI